MIKSKSPGFYDAVPTSVLFERGSGIRNENERWRMVVALHRRGTKEALKAAVEALNSKTLRHRKMGADVLGQLDFKRHRFRDECLRALISRLKIEQSAWILERIGVALDHLTDVRSVRPLGAPRKAQECGCQVRSSDGRFLRPNPGRRKDLS